MTILDNLLKLHAQGRDDVLLRYGLGNEYFKAEEYVLAQQHLRAALAHDAEYSAAWKLLGKAVLAAGDAEQAIEVYTQGIAVAEKRGDIQAAKEMRVFLKRAEKSLVR